MYFKRLEMLDLSTPFLRELFVTLVVGITAFLGGFTYVYDATQKFSEDANKNRTNLTDFTNTFSKIIGCMFFTQISDLFGRKIAILLIYSMYLITFLFIGLDSSSVFLTSHILAGIANGGKSVVFLYVSEISKTERRVTFVFLLSTLWIAGFFLITLAQNQISFLLTIVISGISLIGLILTCFIPESKYWYAIRKDYDNTRASILWFNEDQLPANTAKEIEEITEVEEDGTHNSADFCTPAKYTGIEQFSYSILLLFLCITCNRAINLIFLPKFRDMCQTFGILNDVVAVKKVCSLGMSVIALFLVGAFKRKTLATWICISLSILFLSLLATDFSDQINFIPPEWLELLLFFTLSATMHSFLWPLGIVLTVETISKSNKKRCSILGLLYSLMYLWQEVCLPHVSVILVEAGLITLANMFIVGIVSIFIIVKICIPETCNKPLHYCLSS